MTELRLHDTGTERGLLSYLVTTNPLDRAKTTALLRPDNFYHPSHQLLFETLTRMMREGSVIDWTTIGHRIKRDGNADKPGLREDFKSLKGTSPTAAPREYTDAVLNDFVRRRTLEEAARLREMAVGGADAATLLSHSRTVFQGISTTNVCDDTCTFRDLLHQTYERVTDYTEGKETGCIKTGILALDRLTGGFAPGELVTIAARPGCGKTTLAQTLSYNQAAQGVKVLFLQLEMTDLPQIGMRYVSRLTQINSLRMKQVGGLNADQWGKIYDVETTHGDLPITFSRGGSKRIEEIERIIEIAIQKGCQIAYVDQLSKIRADGDVFQRAAEATNRLSVLAANTMIPIVLLAQINREFQKTASKFPRLHHFKNTGSLEEDSAVCIMLNRPTNEDIAGGLYPDDTAWVSLAKNRNGATADLDSIRFNGQHAVFYDATFDDRDGRSVQNADVPEEVGAPEPKIVPIKKAAQNEIEFKTAAAGG